MIKIHAQPFKEAGKLLKRLPFTRCKLPVLTHISIRAEAGAETAMLAVTNLDQHLETRIPLAEPPDRTEALLIPPDAIRAALKSDKDSIISLLAKGSRNNRMLRLRACFKGIPVETQHPTEDIGDFPQRPQINGPSASIPARTFEMLALVAPCASTEQTRQILNGVYFTPDDGGMLVATDGRRLAGAPATVPAAAGFILPNPAVHVLTHPDFAKQPSTVTLSEKEDECLVEFESDKYLLISKTIVGNYPKWKQVVPHEMVASLTIADDRRAPTVSWLRTLRGRDCTVTLRRKRRGVLQLTHGTSDGSAGTIEVPTAETGIVPTIGVDPAYLATALGIAPVLWLTDSMSPVVARRPDGVFCVVMPMRLRASDESSHEAEAASPSQAAA